MVERSGPMKAGRRARSFDLEAERRSRRRFIAALIGFAVLAIVAGALAAYWILLDGPHAPHPKPLDPPPPAPVRALESPTPLAWDETPERRPSPRRSPPRRRSASLDDRAITNGLARMQQRFNACARDHGALDDSVVRVDFSVRGDGRVSEAFSRPPHQRTPLGRCIAAVVAEHGRFSRSIEGRRDIRRTIELHP